MYGYAVQEAYYTDVWQMAGGGKVAAFCFACIEKEPPYAVALYELDANAVDEGSAIYDRAWLSMPSASAPACGPATRASCKR